jgi:hypothetical protein
VKGKELDHRSDIYSLGVTFYELLSGVCPYRGMTTEYEIYDNIVKEPLLPLTQTMGDAYSAVWSVIEKATQKEINRRFQDCDEFQTALATSKNRASNENKVNSSQKEIPQKKIETQPNKYSNLKKVSVSLGVLLLIGYFLLNGNQPTPRKTGVIKTDKETIVKSLPTNYEDPDKIEQPKIENPKSSETKAEVTKYENSEPEEPYELSGKEEIIQWPRRHVVKKGESLKSISEYYNKNYNLSLTVESLKDYNTIKSNNPNLKESDRELLEETIKAGITLMIPKIEKNQ